MQPQETPDAAGLAQFAFEMGVLKRLRRAGWWHAGVRDPESVAEHSLRVSQLAALIAAQEGADPARAALLAIWHDSQETRTGDLPHSARPYLSGPDPQVITADQVACLPDLAAKTVKEAVAEYEALSTLEARCAHDADKLECLLQAIEYQAAGNTSVQGWIDSSRKGLATPTAQRIAEAAISTSPLAWRGVANHRFRFPRCHPFPVRSEWDVPMVLALWRGQGSPGRRAAVTGSI